MIHRPFALGCTVMSSIPIRFGFKDLHSKSEHESGTRLHNHQLGTKCALSVRDGESPQKINRRQAMTLIHYMGLVCGWYPGEKFEIYTVSPFCGKWHSTRTANWEAYLINFTFVVFCAFHIISCGIVCQNAKSHVTFYFWKWQYGRESHLFMIILMVKKNSRGW